MPEPYVRLVVLNYQGGDDVLRCVDRLLAVDWPPERLEVVVVDNASTDGSADAIANAFPTVRLIRSATNTGFPANNLGLADLEGVDFVGLVNNDAFVEPGYLRPLVDTLQSDPGLGAACPKILLARRFLPVDVETEPGARLVSPPAVVGFGWVLPDDLADPRPVATDNAGRLYLPIGEGEAPPRLVTVVTDHGTIEARPAGAPVDLVNNVGNLLTDDWFGADRGLHEPDAGQYDEPADVFAWCGAAVLFRVRYLDEVGGFDERLFLYYEDLDLAWRGRARGWRYRTVPTAVVCHRLGASSGVGSPLFRFHTERNRLVVLAKNAPAGVVAAAAARHLCATASYLWRDVVRVLLRGRRPAPALAVLRVRAFAGFLRLLPHALRERRRIDRTATVRRAERDGQRTRTPMASVPSPPQSPTTGV